MQLVTSLVLGSPPISVHMPANNDYHFYKQHDSVYEYISGVIKYYRVDCSLQ